MMIPLLIGLSVWICMVFLAGRSTRIIFSGYALIFLLCSSIPLIHGELSGLLVSIVCFACIYELSGLHEVNMIKKRFITISGLLVGATVFYLIFHLIQTQHLHESLNHTSEETMLLPIAITAAGILLVRATTKTTRE